jgi:hypothetical protein
VISTRLDARPAVKCWSVMRLAPLLILASLAGTAPMVGCDRNGTSKGNLVIFKTAEEARAHVQATVITGDRFELAISNNFTFAGKPDTTGAGMAIVVDAILAQEYTVDGFDQRDGYRLYRYKPFAALQPPHNELLQRTGAATRPS